MTKFADLLEAQHNIATAAILGDIGFYASATQASEAAKLNIVRFSDNGQCKLVALNEQECKALAEELNQAIRPILYKWQKRAVEKSKLFMIEVET